MDQRLSDEDVLKTWEALDQRLLVMHKHNREMFESIVAIQVANRKIREAIILPVAVTDKNQERKIDHDNIK